MKPDSPQIDFLDNSAKKPAIADLFGFVIGQDEWLAFLSSEWLIPSKARPLILAREVANNQLDNVIEVWVNVAKLPAINVHVFQDDGWCIDSLRTLKITTKYILWAEVIPLFSVEYFGVKNADRKEHYTAITKSFSNIDLPVQPITIKSSSSQKQPDDLPDVVANLLPPDDWDAFRGAASMAIWSVPAMVPWIELLIETLTPSKKVSSTEISSRWWKFPLWEKSSVAQKEWPLWSAMISVLRKINLSDGWQPKVVFHSICDAAALLGSTDEYLQLLRNKTLAILEDRERIDADFADVDLLGFTLQLLLLRPTPEGFVSWKNEIVSMPPIVWWTGATLSGLISGFRDLDVRFKGNHTARKLTALSVWAGLDSEILKYWPDAIQGENTWRLNQGVLELMLGTEIYAKRNESSRSKWYAADLKDQRTRIRAIELAKSAGGDCVIKKISFNDAQIPFSGPGILCVDALKRVINIEGNISFDMTGDINVSDELDVKRFRLWVLNGRIATRLSDPPSSQTSGNLIDIVGHHVDVIERPIGLTILHDFISAKEEEDLISIIDNSPWITELTRRVQHYGWKYDYKKKKITRDSYLGPIPKWAEELALRLKSSGFLNDLPDQVIVNEYVGKQGISKHMDCKECFKGPITTISLAETWGMTFRKPMVPPFEIYLNRRSATIMDGPARNEWSHEIPKRMTENGVRRNRRISITFRKVKL